MRIYLFRLTVGLLLCESKLVVHGRLVELDCKELCSIVHRQALLWRKLDRSSRSQREVGKVKQSRTGRQELRRIGLLCDSAKRKERS